MIIDIPNPEDGMVTEVFSGVFYQYRERENSWIRINGYESIKSATKFEAGLMTKEDFIKVDELLTAPPKTTLTSEDCDVIFDSGVIGFYSRDKSIFVEDYLDLYGEGNTQREQWHIHEDTWGFNFRVNLNYLVEEMKERGNLISETVVGPKGPAGDRGEPGVDKLDTGPKGEQGENGLNAPFGGTLVNSSGFTVKDKTRAIVDVEVEEISPDENYLVVHKGVISPENFCANLVSAQNIQSSWVLVRNDVSCYSPNSACSPCQTHFIDIDVIIDSIRTHFNNMILRLKQEKEAQVKEWLRTMMQVFNDQKYALCCGLEQCRSRKRNQDERRYIESQRIAAAAADFGLVIEQRSGVDEIDMDQYKSCDGPGWEPTEVVEVNPPAEPEPNNIASLFVESSGDSGSHYTLQGILTSGNLVFNVDLESLGSGGGAVVQYDIEDNEVISFKGTYFTGNIQPDQFIFKINDVIVYDTGMIYGSGSLEFGPVPE